jgi:uncharacterized protein YjbI with pentapeptide repeats
MVQEPRTARERALELLRATLATSTWLPTTEAKRLVWAIRCAIVLGIVVLIASAVDKSLWNWLDLLIVPAVLAIGGYWLNRQQQVRQFTVEERRAQDQALQAYLDQMSQMLADKERPLREASLGDSLSTVARARTLTVLERLADGNHKANVAQFLHESDLIMNTHSVVNLRGANFAGANLASADLNGANFEEADFEGAILDAANLNGTNFAGVTLKNASLYFTELERADLSRAMLDSVYHLDTANLSQANLDNAIIIGVTPAVLGNLTQEQKTQVNFINADVL